MISSVSNNKVKRLVSFVKKAKEREREGVFVVEGVRMFCEAPADWIREVYVSEAFLRKCEKSPDLALKKALERQRYEVLTDEAFQKVSDTQTPQGVLCVLSKPVYELESSIDSWFADGKKAPMVMLLEDLQDPGNLGTIVRSGEGAGVSGIILTKRSADLFNPKVIRSTMGSIYRVPFFVVEGLGGAIQLLQERGAVVYAAHLDDSMDYCQPDYTKPTAFIIGNEGSGLRRETVQMADCRIKIPMAGQVESLNAAIAAAVLMYEAARQQKTKQF